MTISHYFHFFVLLALLISALPSGATAQMAQTEPEKMQSTEAPYLIPASAYSINFVHKPGAKPNEATLRITQPLSMSGCMSVEPLETQTKILGSQLKITVSDPIVKLSKDAQYAQFGCKQSMNTIMADVTINRDEIMENAISKIVMSGPGGQDHYDIYVNQHKLSLFTKTKNTLTGKDVKVPGDAGKILFKPANLSQRKDSLTHWFYPDNLIILYAAPPPGKDISHDITKLANKNGLIGAEKELPGFSSPLTDKSTLYFIDQTGNLGHKLRAGGPTQFGNITMSEVFQGPQGPYNKEKNLPVYARLPGLLD